MTTVGTGLDALFADHQAQITALAGRVSKLEPPPVVPLWSAGMEGGTLAEWSEKVNSGSADSAAVLALTEGIPSKSGLWVMKQGVTGPSGGTRMQRYPEVDSLARAGTPFWWTWWDYFPAPISFGIYDTFIIWGTWGVKAATPGAAADPLWVLVFHPTGNTLDLTFNPMSNPGLPARSVYSSNVPVPVGQWNKFEAYYDPKGRITVWMNGRQLFDLIGQMNCYPLVGQTPLLFGIQQTAYGSGLTPTPCVHYVDDVSLSLGRMP
jgi:hypothetical protein